MLGLARNLEQEPLLISYLVRHKILGLAVTTLEYRMNAGELGSSEQVDLFASFARAEATNFQARALIGECACYASYFRMGPGDAARIYSPIKDSEQEADSRSPLPRKRSLALEVIGFYE